MQTVQTGTVFVKRLFTSLLAAIACATPALAQSGGTSIPEPTNAALLGLGIVGLIVGRQVAKRRD